MIAEGGQEQKLVDGDEHKHSDSWKAFNGDTQAGRLLAKLYGGQKENKINYPVLKTRSRPQNAPFIPGGAKNVSANSRTKHKQTKITDRATNVPRMGVGHYKRPAAIDYVPKRRNEETIKEVSKQDERKYYWAPGVTKGVSTDEEKKRLQRANTHNGGKALPVGMLPDSSAIPEKKSVSKQKLGAAELFDAITLEIEERKQFLDDMEKLGKADEHRARIQAEIKERVADMQLCMKHMNGE